MKDITILLKLIGILSDGGIHSGDELVKLLNVGLSSINRYIHVFRRWGIEVNTITNNEYQFVRKLDLLDHEQIYSLVQGGNIIIKTVVNSTNQYLLERIDQLTSGDVCIAEHQTAGRGRRNRHWISPFGCNLYLSLYWYLQYGPVAAMGISLVTGIVVAETLNKLSGDNNIKVKWPNDLYLHEKKLAGILVEMIGKTDDAAHIVIGIGLNIAMRFNYANETNIDQEWINFEQAGSNATNIQAERNMITGQVILALRHELVQFEKYGFIPFIKRWLALDNFLYKRVKLCIDDRFEIGVVKGINEQGAILLEQNDRIVSYTSGVITLRPED